MVLYTLGTRNVPPLKEQGIIQVDKHALEAYNIYASPVEKDALHGYATSYYTLEGHIKSIEEYGRPHAPQPDNPSWQKAKQYVLNKFKSFDKVDAISTDHLDQVSWIRSSAAGFGYTGKKGDFDNYSKARAIASAIAHECREGRAEEQIVNSTPDIAFSRTQLTPYLLKEKTRNVWGAAFHYILLEGCYAQPVIEWFKQHDEFYFVGTDPLHSVPIKIENMLRNFDVCYSIDWSGFDASAQAWEITHAFECIREMLNFHPSDRDTVFNFLIDLFIYRKVVRPDGIEVLKDLGVPSGSAFTNLVDSIINYTRIQYIWIHLTGKPVQAYVQGDDSLCGLLKEQVVPPVEIDAVSRPHNWKVNWSKTDMCYRHTLPSFLSRTIRRGQMYRNELELLRKFVYPEYSIDDPTISALRGFALWKDGGMSSQTLHKCWLYLKTAYGIAQELPIHLRLHRV